MTTCLLVSGRAITTAKGCSMPRTCSIPVMVLKICSRPSAPETRLRGYKTVYKASLSSNAKTNSRASEQRDLFVDILSSNATRRDAKQFLARLNDTPTTKIQRACPAVNLGSLYTRASAIANTPQFVRDHASTDTTKSSELHIALISLRDVHSLDNATITGLAITIAQLVKLGMHILFVLSHIKDHTNDISSITAAALEQATRLAKALDQHCPQGARVVTDALMSTTPHAPLELVSPRLIFDPLSQGTVTIVPTLAYSPEWKITEASHADVVLTLIAKTQEHALRLDRVILLDPLGGIPSRSRQDNAHVFINLEQEYADIQAELDGMRSTIPGIDTHINNLQLLNMALTTLPHSASALIVSPQEAAVAAATSTKSDNHAIGGAGTRKQKNTLIHNLLTNKPIVSSSLPTARFAQTTQGSPAPTTATLVKKGMPLTIIPGIEHRKSGWRRPVDSPKTTLDLETDPRIDLPRLVDLINDSFRRKLDVPAYLDRIRGRVAGLIIAGNYEGGAILTWESPSGETLDDSSRLVPYLDKFAVLQSSQGSAGVADIVFEAMVRSCFPYGVCWRSRSNNPVNKWYFERAAGSWTIPDTQWTMFWTGQGVVDDRQRWDDYVAVCRGIVPTWADSKVPD